MKFKMEKDGFSATGVLGLQSSGKMFRVNGDYSASFKVAKGFDTKLEKGIFDRYLAVVGRELAKKWLAYEKKATAPLQKLMDAEDKALLKNAEKMSKKGATSSDIVKLKEATEAKLNKDGKDLIKNDLEANFKKAVDESHAAGMKAIEKEAKSVLKSKGKIVYQVAITIGKFALGVVGAVAAGAGIGTAAGGPVGTAVGAGAGAVIAIGATVIKGITSLATLASSAKSMRADFHGNYKAYEDSIQKLNKQMDETIKLSRGLTAKWDALHLRQIDMQNEMADLVSKVPADATKKDKQVKAVMDAQKSIWADGASIQKIMNYKPTEIERALVEARGLIKDKCDPAKMGEGVEKANKWFGRLGQWAAAANAAFKIHAS